MNITYETLEVLQSTLTEVIQSDTGGKKARHDQLAFPRPILVASVHARRNLAFPWP